MEIKKELINIIVLGILDKKDYNSTDLYDKMQEIVSISEGSLFKVIKSLEDAVNLVELSILFISLSYKSLSHLHICAHPPLLASLLVK